MLGGGGVLLSSLHRLGGGLTHPTLAKTLAKSLSSITPWHNRVLAKTRRLRRVHGPAPGDPLQLSRRWERAHQRG